MASGAVRRGFVVALALTAVARAEPPAPSPTPAPWTACGAICDKQERGCTFECGESRGCMRICSSHAIDCRAGCAQGMAAEAVARMRAWIEGPLAGNDSGKAKLQMALIERGLDDGGGVPAYEAFIKNELGLRCGLTWDVNGRPAVLKHCRASEQEVTPPEIPLQCALDSSKKRERCAGTFRRRSGATDEKSTLTLVRAVK